MYFKVQCVILVKHLFVLGRLLFLPESAGVVRLMDSAVKLKRIGWSVLLGDVLDHLNRFFEMNCSTEPIR